VVVVVVVILTTELKIKILQGSPRDADKLRAILQVKEVEYERGTD
jgi:hypothetical protein